MLSGALIIWRFVVFLKGTPAVILTAAEHLCLLCRSLVNVLLAAWTSFVRLGEAELQGTKEVKEVHSMK